MTQNLPASLSQTISATAKSDIDLLASLQWVAKHHGISPLKQMREIWSLQRTGRRLEPDRYFYYRLYRPEIAPEAKRRFVGIAMQRAIILACNAFTWWQAAQDKLCFAALMRGSGFPVPVLHAIAASNRHGGGAAMLENAPSLQRWLASAPYPCFMKPADSALGEGATALTGYDAAEDAVEMRDGKRIPAGDVWKLAQSAKGGLIFQELLEPHPALVPLTGPRIASVRLVVLLREDGPLLFDAAWRVPVGANMVDNFFRLGNCMAAIDPATGAVGRVMQGKGTAMRAIETHPDSGAAFAGWVLPDWPQAVAMTLEASRLFPGIRLQSWDVALTDRGPVFLEMNPGGNIDQRQFLQDEGLWHGELKEFVQRCHRDNVNAELNYPRKYVAKLLA